MKANKAAEAKADRDWAAAVKTQAGGRCEVCGKAGTDAAHVVSRRYKATRHVVANGWYACRSCHAEHHGHVLKIYGRDEHGALQWERVEDEPFAETLADA